VPLLTGRSRYSDDLQPLPVTEFPECLLRRLELRLEEPVRFDCPQVVVVGLVVDTVLRERLVAEFDGQRLPVQPQCGPLPGQSPFTIESPVAEANVAQLVNPPKGACLVEDPMELDLFSPEQLRTPNGPCRGQPAAVPDGPPGVLAYHLNDTTGRPQGPSSEIQLSRMLCSFTESYMRLLPSGVQTRVPVRR
jgi:hypothetical protein